MKKNLMVLFICMLAGLCHGQKQGNVWYFGNSAGIDFNTTTPTPLSSSLYAADNSSSISDTAGNVLFYTNGEDIWNSNHQIMTNGTGLMGSGDAGQSSLIIQQPNSNFYYVFTVDYIGGPNGLRYSIVDMSLQGGLGEVIQKNVLLYAPTTEKLAAIYNCSEQKYWLITHKWNTAEFYIYEINSSGIVITPVITTIGSVHTGGSGVNNACGQMSITKDGTRLAVAKYLSGTVELFDFNSITGVVSNAQLISGYSQAWGVEFSPNASRLYLTQITTNTIRQFDLNAGTLSDIINSEVIVGNTSAQAPYYNGTLQLGPDNKIYCSKWNSHYLAAINDPDSQGANCNFSDTAIFLGSLPVCLAGLTRTIVPNCNVTAINYSNTSTTMSFYPNPSTGIIKINSLRDHLNLKVFDSLGNMVYACNVSGEVSVDLRFLTEGIYQLMLDDQSGIQSKKLVIVH